MQYDFRIPIAPVPASRPRVTRRGISYYAEPYKTFKTELKKWFIRNWRDDPIDHVMDIDVTIVATRPRTTKLPMPKPDGDNYLKAVQDAMNKVVVEDDWLFRESTVRKQWAPAGESGEILVTITRA